MFFLTTPALKGRTIPSKAWKLSSAVQCRYSHHDTRSRLSSFWVPTGGISPASSTEDSHALLIRAGFLRQAHSGFFHLLPLGLRVQEKLEGLVNKHMRQLGASQVSLSSISSADLWHRSGRLSANKELFCLQDRKKTEYLLSPTHEEEITSLVAGICQSYKELPLRLYQISRKYRDEPRPRQGLLRTREFLMKDLYTFDYSPELATVTYDAVREAYHHFFDELKIPYLVAEAESGNMGGSLSHEFLFPTSKGEDNVVHCSACGYAANEELAEGPIESPAAQESTGQDNPETDVSVWSGITHDRLGLINVFYPSRLSGPSDRAVNTHAVKRLVPSLDAGVENPVDIWEKNLRHGASTEDHSYVIVLFDHRLPPAYRSSEVMAETALNHSTAGSNIPTKSLKNDPKTGRPLNLLSIETGDSCPRCAEGVVGVTKAIELGHTFNLGTRYSKPFGASVKTKGDEKVDLQMGCHGIGISRTIGAVADALADDRGLNWPRVMAPFEVVVIPDKQSEQAAQEVYDLLSPSREVTPAPSGQQKMIDTLIDDRDKVLAWKLKDADLAGYPVVVVLGKGWRLRGLVEVQCRRLGDLRQEVPLPKLADVVRGLLDRL